MGTIDTMGTVDIIISMHQIYYKVSIFRDPCMGNEPLSVILIISLYANPYATCVQKCVLCLSGGAAVH